MFGLVTELEWRERERERKIARENKEGVTEIEH